MAPPPARDFKLHRIDRGAGPPVVLLHGFPLDGRMWETQAAELAGRHRVILPDLPGFGASSSNDFFSIEAMADAVHEALGELHALPCVLGGLSMGGYVALAYARKYPGDLRGLMLVDTRAQADTAEQKSGRDRMIALAQSRGSGAIAEQMASKLLAPDTPKNRPAVARALDAMMQSCPARTIENALAAMRDRPDQTDFLPRMMAPALVIVGDADAITPPAVARQMAESIPNSQLVVIRGAGHMSPMEQPAQVIQAMVRFLKELA